jgi:imidazolonepropionase-like amidohydrolase
MSDDLTRVRAGWLIDVVAGEVLRDRVIGIRGDRIESIGDDDGSPVEVDLSEHTVLPGLIDSHAHLIGEIEGGHGTRSSCSGPARRRRSHGVRNARDTVMAGFTTYETSGRSARSSTWRSATRSRPATWSGLGCCARGPLRHELGRWRRT